MQEFLKIGDVVRLEQGIRIGASVPRRFCVQSFSMNELYTARFQIGDKLYKKLQNRNETVHKVATTLSTLLEEQVNEEAVSDFLDTLGLDFSPETFDTSVFAGVYRVYEIYHIDAKMVSVWCEKVDDPEVKVFVEQLRTMNGVRPYIEPIEEA